MYIRVLEDMIWKHGQCVLTRGQKKEANRAEWLQYGGKAALESIRRPCLRQNILDSFLFYLLLWKEKHLL
jgi:hypothetical protein